MRLSSLTIDDDVVDSLIKLNAWLCALPTPFPKYTFYFSTKSKQCRGRKRLPVARRSAALLRGPLNLIPHLSQCLSLTTVTAEAFKFDSLESQRLEPCHRPLDSWG